MASKGGHPASHGKRLLCYKTAKAPYNTSTAKSTSSLPILRVPVSLQFHACATSSEFPRFLWGVTQCNHDFVQAAGGPRRREFGS